jgi:hypothetical protein
MLVSPTRGEPVAGTGSSPALARGDSDTFTFLCATHPILPTFAACTLTYPDLGNLEMIVTVVPGGKVARILPAVEGSDRRLLLRETDASCPHRAVESHQANNRARPFFTVNPPPEGFHFDQGSVGTITGRLHIEQVARFEQTPG